MAKKESEMEVAVAEVVDYLRIRGDFSAALAEVVERKVVADAARSSGMKVSAKELQRAADVFRSLYDLHRASDTEAWMKSNGITLEALEGYLETNILISRYKDKLAKKSAGKVVKSKPVQNAIREAAYREWLAKALK